MASRPTLSVIVTNYNHARVLPRALDALLAQQPLPLEILVVDDGSTDDSRQVLGHYAHQHARIRPVHLPHNQGVAAATRHGVEQACGDLVYLAAADDEVLPGFFAAALGMMRRFPQAGLVFGKMVMVDAADRPLDSFGVSAWREDLFAGPQRFLQEFLERELPGHSLCAATIYRRESFLEAGGYRADLGHWMDTFAARAVGLRRGVCYLARPVMKWTVSEGGLALATSVDDALAIAGRAAALMRSPEFADVFPAAYVARWEKQYRLEVFRASLRRRHARLLGWFGMLGKPGLHLREWVLRRLARRASRHHRTAA